MSERLFRVPVGLGVVALLLLLAAAPGSALAAAPALPDLVVTTAAPARPGVQAIGSQVAFVATVTNRGSAPTPAGVVVGVAFLVDGVEVTWSDSSTASLAPGASVRLTANSGPAASATWTAQEGSHTLSAVVDDVARIHESVETNNQRDRALDVAAVQPVGGVTTRPGLTQETFTKTRGRQTRTTWTVPAGQPVGTTYTLVEHSVPVDSLCAPSAESEAKRTVTKTSARTTMSLGHYCVSRSYGYRVTYSVIARGGSTAAESALSGTCDWIEVRSSSFEGAEWRFACDGSPVLTAYDPAG